MMPLFDAFYLCNVTMNLPVCISIATYKKVSLDGYGNLANDYMVTCHFLFYSRLVYEPSGIVYGRVGDIGSD